MKRIAFLLIVFLFAACVPVPAPATETPTLTLAPTRTPTLTPTATITPTPAPSLPADFPPEFQAQIGDADFEIRDGHVWVTTADGSQQDWFEQTPEGAWQTSDFKMHQETPLKIGFEPERNWDWENGAVSLLVFPVVTGEPPVEKNMVINGQEVTVTLLPVQIRDILDPKVIKDVFLPLIYKDANGLVMLETWVLFESRKNEVITIAEFLQNIQRGQQLEVNLHLLNNKVKCQGDFRCEGIYELNQAQELDIENKVLRDGDILPIEKIKNWFPLGYIYGNLNR